jgi:hypothetical protein
MSNMPPTEKARQLAVVFGALALLIPLLTVVFNRGGDQVAVVAGPDSMRAVSGPFSWRYFEWEMFGDNEMITRGGFSVHDALGVDAATGTALVKLIDVFDPTLFHISLVFAVAALIARRRAKAVATVVGAVKPPT